VGGDRGLRIAFVGKGGAGKSLIAGTVCRILGRNGQCVLAMDVDTMVGLSVSLGLGHETAPLPGDLAERVEGRGWQVKAGLRPARIVDRYARRGPDNVAFLTLGKLPGNVQPAVTVAFRSVLDRFRRPGWSIVADLAAGTRQPMFGWAEFARTVIVVADPSAKSLISAQRLVRAGIGTHLVVNKVQDDADLANIQRDVPLPLIGVLPYDPEVGEAEKWGKAPIDAASNSPALRAIGALTQRLMELER
jgi:CO dehydrogenase maturation factor